MNQCLCVCVWILGCLTFFSQVCARTVDVKQPTPVCMGSYTRVMNYFAFYCIQWPVDHNINEGNIPVYHCRPLWALSRGMWVCFATINYGITFWEVIFTLSQVSIAPSLPSSLPLFLPPTQVAPPSSRYKLRPQGVRPLWAHIPGFPLCGCLSVCYSVS